MKYVLMGLSLGLGFGFAVMQAAHVAGHEDFHPQDQADLRGLEEQISRCEAEVKRQHEMIATKRKEHALKQSAAHARVAKRQKTV